jgi:hypothetical protein
VKEDIDDILVPPGDLELVFMIDGQYIFQPTKTSHSSQVHQHHTGIDSQRTVVRVPSKPVVPETQGNSYLQELSTITVLCKFNNIKFSSLITQLCTRILFYSICTSFGQ